jgi:hypothetical protein
VTTGIFGEVLAGVKHLPRYATLLTSSSPSFRHSSLNCSLFELFDLNDGEAIAAV